MIKYKVMMTYRYANCEVFRYPIRSENKYAWDSLYEAEKVYKTECDFMKNVRLLHGEFEVVELISYDEEEPWKTTLLFSEAIIKE